MLTFMRNMMLMFIAAFIITGGGVYAMLQAAESRCADSGDTQGRETVLLANGECRILEQDAELYLPKGMGNGLSSDTGQEQ